MTSTAELRSLRDKLLAEIAFEEARNRVCEELALQKWFKELQ